MDLCEQLAMLQQKYDTLLKIVYESSWQTTLPDTLSYYVTYNKHKVSKIRGYIVLKSTGEEVEVAFKLFSDKSIRIDSNISLLDCKFILY